MKTTRNPLAFAQLAVVALAFLTAARPARAEEVDARKVGVGYKIGNGLGFEGADVVIRGLPHVSFDMQVNYLYLKDSPGDGTSATFSGVGLAPAVQLQLKSTGHTPYLSVGALYVRLTAHHETDSGNISGTGFFANLGYEWRFASGVGVMVGAGIADILTVQGETDSTSFYGTPSKLLFNIESGVRYFF